MGEYLRKRYQTGYEKTRTKDQKWLKLVMYLQSFSRHHRQRATFSNIITIQNNKETIIYFLVTSNKINKRKIISSMKL